MRADERHPVALRDDVNRVGRGRDCESGRRVRAPRDVEGDERHSDAGYCTSLTVIKWQVCKANGEWDLLASACECAAGYYPDAAKARCIGSLIQ